MGFWSDIGSSISSTVSNAAGAASSALSSVKDGAASATTTATSSIGDKVKDAVSSTASSVGDSVKSAATSTASSVGSAVAEKTTSVTDSIKDRVADAKWVADPHKAGEAIIAKIKPHDFTMDGVTNNVHFMAVDGGKNGSIVAGAGNDALEALNSKNVNLDPGAGINHVRVSGDNININATQGTNTVTLDNSIRNTASITGHDNTNFKNPDSAVTGKYDLLKPVASYDYVTKSTTYAQGYDGEYNHNIAIDARGGHDVINLNDGTKSSTLIGDTNSIVNYRSPNNYDMSVRGKENGYSFGIAGNKEPVMDVTGTTNGAPHLLINGKEISYEQIQAAVGKGGLSITPDVSSYTTTTTEHENLGNLSPATATNGVSQPTGRGVQ